MDSVNEPRQLLGIYDFGTMNYRYQATSIVHSIGGDSVPRTDSTWVTASLSVTFLEASSSRLRHAIAQAESIQVSPLNTSTSPLGTVQLLENQQDTLSIDRQAGAITINHRQPVCIQSTQEWLFRGDELVPPIPLFASATRSWADTSTQDFCRGGVRISLTRVTRYRFEEQLAESRTTNIRLLRVSELHFIGIGLHW